MHHLCMTCILNYIHFVLHSVTSTYTFHYQLKNLPHTQIRNNNKNIIIYIPHRDEIK